MSRLIHIVAYNKDKVIGIKDKLPFTLKEDLETFKHLTDGSLIAMGFNTFKSIVDNHMQNKTDFLPGRHVSVVCSNSTNVVKRSTEYQRFSNVTFLTESLFRTLVSRNREAIVIVGGAKMYSLGTPSIVIATEVDVETPTGTPEADLVKYPVNLEQLSYKRLSFGPRTSQSGLNYQTALYIQG